MREKIVEFESDLVEARERLEDTKEQTSEMIKSHQTKSYELLAKVSESEIALEKVKKESEEEI